MSKPVDDFAEYVVHDVLGGLKGITTRKMFGGCSLYLDGVIFALITSECDLYFKVNDSNRSLYEEMGSHPFTYSGWKDKKRKPVVMPYWHIDEALMENREKIEELATLSAHLND